MSIVIKHSMYYNVGIQVIKVVKRDMNGSNTNIFQGENPYLHIDQSNYDSMPTQYVALQ